MIDESSLFTFAASCALSYCRRFGSTQLDDATQDAALYLLEHREMWGKPRNYLRKRVIFALVRNFQNDKGLRRKNKLRKIELDVFSLAENRRVEDSRSVAAREKIAAAIRNGGLGYASEVVELIVDGWNRRAIAKRFKLSFHEVSEIQKKFFHELKRLEDTTTENNKEKYPLFYFDNNRSENE